MFDRAVRASRSVVWWAPLFLGLTLTVVCAWLLQQHNGTRALERSRSLADQVAGYVTERTFLYQYGLRGLRGAIVTAGADALTREQFERYSASRDPAREFPGALGFGFIRRVDPENQEFFVARMRADGAPAFSVRSASPHEGDQFVVQYFSHARGNGATEGLDIGSDSRLRDAAVRAAREGELQASAPFPLTDFQGQGRTGLLVILPIFPPDAMLGTPQDRERQVLGWVFAPVVVDEALSSLQSDHSEVYVQLFQRDAVKPFFSTWPDEGRGLSPVVERDLFVVGQPWRMRVAMRDAAQDHLQLLSPWWVIWLGLGLTCLALYGSHQLQAQASGLSVLPEDTVEIDAGFRTFLASSLVRRSWPPAAVALLLIIITVGVWAVRSDLNSVRDRLHTVVSEAADTIEKARAAYRRDVLFLADAPAVRGLIKSVSDEWPGEGGVAPEDWRRQIAQIFEAYMLNNPHLYQVRLIEVRSNWRESVKVQRTGESLDVFDESLLQVKANEPYIAQTLQVGLDRVHVSELNLNREHGAIERPHRPVWRFSTPLYGADAQPFGIVIINVSADPLLQTALSAGRALDGLYITGPRGDYLSHPNAAMAFGFDLGTPHRWDEDAKPVRALPWLAIDGATDRRIDGNDYWVRSAKVTSVDHPGVDIMEIHGAASKFDTYIALAGKLGVLSTALLILGLAGAGWQYVLWSTNQRRQWEDHLQRQARVREGEREVFKALVDSAPDATVIVDEEGIIQLANAQAERLFGHDRSALIGQPVDCLLPERFADGHRAKVAGFMRRPSTRAMGEGKQLFARRADGTELPVEISLGTMRAGGRLLVSAAVRDISERLAIEQRLRQAIHAIEAANQAKSAFLANTSHEIRTPLNAVIGLSHLLSDDALTAHQQSLVRKIQLSGQSLLGIVNDVLDLSKIEANEVVIEQRPVDLRELLEEIGSVFAPQAEAKHLRFKLEFGADLPLWVVTDPTRLRQIIVNLLGNALKFTTIGEIAVSAGVGPDAPETPDDVVVMALSVTDTGIGIPLETQQRLFMPFSQADVSTTRKYGGTGLGLSIVRRLAELMGGIAGVDSQDGVGSRFWVHLPLRLPSPQEIAAQDSQNTALSVLIAEDDPTDAARLEGMTRALGWRAQVVPDGAALVDAYIERRDVGMRSPDVILVDWEMPRLDGLSALRTLADRVGLDKMPAVLVISVHEREHIAALDHTHLAGRILHKPVDSSELFNAVNDVVTAHTGNTQRVMQSTRPESVDAQWLPGVRVLVVDDSAINLEVVSKILERNGADVVTADSGEAALARLNDAPAGFDAVLMDVQMPRMDGLEATRLARQSLGLSKLPIIGLTAGALVEERQRALAAGMSDFLTKPIDPSLLIKRVRLSVENHRGSDLPIRSVHDDAPNDDDWPAIEGLNAEQAKRVLMGDSELMLSTLQRMLTEYGDLELLPGAESATTEHEARLGLAARVHKLRGAAGLIGAERVYELASDAERSLRRPDASARAVLRELSDALAALRLASAATLRAWQETREAEPLPTDPGETPTEATAMDLQPLCALLAAQDMGALVEASRHVPTLRRVLGDADVVRLQDAIRRLDFAQALAFLRPALASIGSTPVVRVDTDAAGNA